MGRLLNFEDKVIEERQEALAREFGIRIITHKMGFVRALHKSIQLSGIWLKKDKNPVRRQRFQCERRESNPHSLSHKILSLARLPIPPLSQNNSFFNQSEQHRQVLSVFCLGDCLLAIRVQFRYNLGFIRV